jgi:hypothetical protein
MAKGSQKEWEAEHMTVSSHSKAKQILFVGYPVATTQDQTSRA